jgi:hypothetical protein
MVPSFIINQRWNEDVSGSLDECVEKDGTFYLTKDNLDGIFFRLFYLTNLA